MVELANAAKPPTVGVDLERMDHNDARFITTNGKFAGQLYEDIETGETIFVGFKKRSLLFKKFDSYAISSFILESLEDRGINTIILIDDGGDFYKFNLDTYLESDNNYNHRDHDKQKAPPLSSAEEVHEGVALEYIDDFYPEEIHL